MILNGSRTTSDEYNRKVSEHRAENFSLAPFGRLSPQRSQRQLLWSDFLSRKNQTNNSVRLVAYDIDPPISMFGQRIIQIN